MPNYYLCSIFFFFCPNTKRTQSNSEKKSMWSRLKELLRKKVWFSFSFFLFHCWTTLIGFCCVANLASLTQFEGGKGMNKKSLLILFRFRYRFQGSFFSPQTPIYWLWRFIVYLFIFSLVTKRGKFVRGGKLSTTQTYNTQSIVKTDN